MTAVTLWDPAANSGAGGVAVIDGVPMRHQTIANRRRPPWSLAMRIDPSHPERGNCGELAGLIILLEEAAPDPQIGTDEKLGPLGADPSSVDFVAGTASYARTVLSKPVAERKAEMTIEATRLSWEYRNAGALVTVGPQTVTLSTSHDAVVELMEASNQVGGGSSLGVVTRSGSRLTLDTALVDAARQAVRERFAAGCQYEFDMHEAIDGAADHAGLDAIDLVGSLPAPS